MSIRDFFKPRVDLNGPTPNPAQNPSPKKTAPNTILIEDDQPRAAATNDAGVMKRSAKSLSSSRSISKVTSPKKTSTSSRPSNNSSLKSSPIKTRSKDTFVIDGSDDEDLFSEIPDNLDEFEAKGIKKAAADVTPTKNKDVYLEESDTVAEDDDDYEDEFDETARPKGRKRASKVTKAEVSPSPKKSKKETDSIETESVAEATPKKKFNYYALMAKKSAGPAAPGSKEIPVGSPNCLEGVTFVFTGELSSISRDDAQDLVKRYGGRVTGSPSGKTDYVVLGENAGASKLEKIEKLSLKTLDEDGLFELIRSRSTSNSKAAETEAKSTVPTVKAEPAKKAAVSTTPASHSQEVSLWTVKWAPSKPDELIGNHSIYEKLLAWLQSWKSGIPTDFRAALLSGPPGIGKTTMAHMACKQAGFESVEMNASDTRSKKKLHEEVREVINNTSLTSFFQAKQSKQQPFSSKLQCIIMDECDGMSSGDRGGMAELIQLIKKTKIPFICLCNDRASPKVRSLTNYCMDLRFRRPDARQVVPRVSEICRREGLQVSANTIEELVASTQGDIRQIITLLSTYRLTNTALTFDDSKRLADGSKKDIEEGPFDAVHTLLSGQGFSRLNMNQKIDLYFVDGGLMPLMVQENYLKCRASTSRTVHDAEYGAKSASFMTLAWAAADSISQADSVDSLIRGYNQEWSLAPLHAVHSCVRPAYFCSGNVGGRIDFASWLGQNSKQAKYQRLLKELTQHLYLHTRANRQTLCLDYAPTMACVIMRHLQSVETIDKAIDFLDAYVIAKEDLEPMLEIVLDSSCNAAAYAKLPTSTKSAFTRKYNQGSHMLPYALGASAPVRRVKTDVNSGATEGDDSIGDDIESGEMDNGEDEGNDDEDISKDKMIKMASAGGKHKKTATSSKRGGKK